MNETGRRLRNLRTDIHITQGDLAKKVGMSGQVISNIERGYTEMTTEQAAKFARFFQVSIDYLLDSPSPEIPGSIILDDEEMKLISAFRELSEDYRDIVMGEVKKALLMQRRESGPLE